MIQLILSGIVGLTIVGLMLWIVAQIPSIPAVVKTILYVEVGVGLLLLILQYIQSEQFHVNL